LGGDGRRDSGARRRLRGMRSACLPAEVCAPRSPVSICLSLPTSRLKRPTPWPSGSGPIAFRLFIRGVIHYGDGFMPDETTSYVSAAQVRTFTETLVALGVVAAGGRDRYRLVRHAGSFGGTVEW
jgi:hypothetical protein